MHILLSKIKALVVVLYSTNYINTMFFDNQFSFEALPWIPLQLHIHISRLVFPHCKVTSHTRVLHATAHRARAINNDIFVVKCFHYHFLSVRCCCHKCNVYIYRQWSIELMTLLLLKVKRSQSHLVEGPLKSVTVLNLKATRLQYICRWCRTDLVTFAWEMAIGADVSLAECAEWRSLQVNSVHAQIIAPRPWVGTQSREG